MITSEFYSQIMAETRASNRRFREECLRLAHGSASSIRTYSGPTPKLIEVTRAYCHNCRQKVRMVCFANEPQDVFCDECGQDYQAD